MERVFAKANSSEFLLQLLKYMNVVFGGESYSTSADKIGRLLADKMIDLLIYLVAAGINKLEAVILFKNIFCGCRLKDLSEYIQETDHFSALLEMLLCGLNSSARSDEVREVLLLLGAMLSFEKKVTSNRFKSKDYNGPSFKKILEESHHNNNLEDLQHHPNEQVRDLAFYFLNENLECYQD